MSRVKVAVLANCQARPIAELLKRLNADVEIVSIVITHLAKQPEREAVYQALQAADVILAQAVQHTYPIQFVRTDELKMAFGAKLVTWPNLFFKGHSPDLCYLTKADGRRVVGGLGEYQNINIYEAWRSGLSTTETERLLLEGEAGWAERLPGVVARSFSDLRSREQGLDVRIADRIEAQWQEHRLFHTFNHPVSSLLQMVAEDLLTLVDLPFDREAGASVPETLDRIIPPLLPATVRRLDLRLPSDTKTKGVRVKIGEQVNFDMSTVYYELHEFVDNAFQCLHAQVDRTQDLRVT